MPPALPEGEIPPSDGSFPAAALDRFSRAAEVAATAKEPRAADAEAGTFGAYVHVPFCLRRCGYCDFNTYAPGDLGVTSVDSPVATYLQALHTEIDLATRLLPRRPFDTVFLGGGTPTLLRPEQIGGVLEHLRDGFGLVEGAEITTEANPDTVDAATIAALAEAGITRISLGMQSAVPHVLSVLDRTHEPAAVGRAVAAAREVGLATSVDLIYGAPGESLADWRVSLEAALALEPDHVSAYALVIEEGTRMAAQVRRGELPMPEDDDEADKYELADDLLSAAGFSWYEVSNWSRTARGVCRHNEGYWRSGDWWGFGPGAHGHVRGVRWWNAKHPAAYAARLAGGLSPAVGREVLDDEQMYEEDVLLRIRLAEGLPLARLRPAGRATVPGLESDGLVDLVREGDAVRLTLRGRLLADTVVRRLLG